MDVDGRVAVVTGGGGGIGGALAEKMVDAGALVVVADLDVSAAMAVVGRIETQWPGRAVAVAADVAGTADIARVLEVAATSFGPVDLYIANAGIGGAHGLEATDAAWAAALDVNVMAHVRAARLLVPDWVARGGGYFVATASAAGLLTQLEVATYSASKHAAVAFAEWLSIHYGDQGVKVSCLCPMGVDTALLQLGEDIEGSGAIARAAVTAAGDVLQPSDVADVVLRGIADERFLILPHPSVERMFLGKATDYDHWLDGMRRYRARLVRRTDPTTEETRP